MSFQSALLIKRFQFTSSRPNENALQERHEENVVELQQFTKTRKFLT